MNPDQVEKKIAKARKARESVAYAQEVARQKLEEARLALQGATRDVEHWEFMTTAFDQARLNADANLATAKEKR